MPEAAFTPAAGRFLPTSAYDRLLALLTREATWRANLLEALAPKPGERILDVGCGNGWHLSLLDGLGFTNLTGIDPFLPGDMHQGNVRIKAGSFDVVDNAVLPRTDQQPAPNRCNRRPEGRR